MARKVRTVVDVIDDFTGKIDAAADTVDFSYRGTAYQIELGPESAAQLEQALAPFISVARKVKKTSKTHGAKSTAAQSDERKRIRKWARENGHNVAPVGRIDRDVIAAYHRAHSTPAEQTIAAREVS
ncbi:histone-like nucleoid-structuring protein Lsr2 [Nocardia sp. NPDC004260]